VADLNQKIQYLPASNYREFLRGSPDGLMGETHLAKILWSDGIERDSWVKIYGARHPRSLVNEMIGYLLGSALNLPCPNLAGFLMVETKVLDSELIDKLNPVDRYRGYTFAWVTEDVGGINPRIELENNPSSQQIIFEYLSECLINWDYLAGMLAFDDWILNSDRNLGNLIRLPDKTFCLIDHGQSMKGEQWNESDLLNAHCEHSGALDVLYFRILFNKFSSDGLFQYENTLKSLCDEKAKHHAAFLLAQDELESHLNDMIGDEFIETGIEEMPSYPVSDTVIKFLNDRAVALNKFTQRCDTFFGIKSIAKPMS